jgi:hypothetical protein
MKLFKSHRAVKSNAAFKSGSFILLITNEVNNLPNDLGMALLQLLRKGRKINVVVCFKIVHKFLQPVVNIISPPYIQPGRVPSR